MRTLAQFRVVHAAQIVTGLWIPRLADFVEHFAGVRIVEIFSETQPLRDLRDDLPVGARFAGRRDGARHEGDVALGIHHRALGLGPERAGQQNVRVARGLRRMKRVLHDDQFRALQTGDDAAAVRHRGDGIGADDPNRLDFARLQFLKSATASSPGCGEMVPAGTPQIFSTAARSSASVTARWPGNVWLK